MSAPGDGEGLEALRRRMLYGKCWLLAGRLSNRLDLGVALFYDLSSENPGRAYHAAVRWGSASDGEPTYLDAGGVVTADEVAARYGVGCPRVGEGYAATLALERHLCANGWRGRANEAIVSRFLRLAAEADAPEGPWRRIARYVGVRPRRAAA